MKIAYVSDAIYPYNKGGKEKRLFDISTRLAKLGHEVHIYCMKWWKGKEKYRFENGVHLHAISGYYPLYSGERRSIKEGIFFGLSCLKMIKEDWDVIDVDHMPFFPIIFTKIVCILKRKKMIATWHEVWGLKYWKKYLGWKGYIAYIIEYISVGMPDEIISVSTHTTKKLQDEFNVKQLITTIPNGINLKEIKSVNPSKEKSDVIFAGRLLSHKNVDVLIKAILLLKKDYPNIKCVIVGKGPEKRKLLVLVERLKLQNNIKFYDFLESQNDLYALMKSSKVFVLPSTREGFGIIALEANATGIPVITTDHSENATKDLIINSKNGFVVKLDSYLIANKINVYLSKDNNNYHYQTSVSRYDWKNITTKTMEVYNS